MPFTRLPLSLQTIRLSCWPLLRDSTYYTLSISALIVVSDQVINLPTRDVMQQMKEKKKNKEDKTSPGPLVLPLLLQFIYDEKVVW